MNRPIFGHFWPTSLHPSNPRLKRWKSKITMLQLIQHSKIWFSDCQIRVRMCSENMNELKVKLSNSVQTWIFGNFPQPQRRCSTKRIFALCDFPTPETVTTRWKSFSPIPEGKAVFHIFCEKIDLPTSPIFRSIFVDFLKIGDVGRSGQIDIKSIWPEKRCRLGVYRPKFEPAPRTDVRGRAQILDGSGKIFAFRAKILRPKILIGFLAKFRTGSKVLADFWSFLAPSTGGARSIMILFLRESDWSGHFDHFLIILVKNDGLARNLAGAGKSAQPSRPVFSFKIKKLLLSCFFFF